MNNLEIFINGNVPSSKNGKRWTGKYLIHSKTTMRYIKDSKEEYLDNAQLFRDYVKELNPPYVIHFCFWIIQSMVYIRLQFLLFQQLPF